MSNLEYYLLEKEGESSKCGMLDLGKCMDSDENSTGETVFTTSTNVTEVPSTFTGNGNCHEEEISKEDDSISATDLKLGEQTQVVESSDDQILRFIATEESCPEVSEDSDMQVEKDMGTCESADIVLKDIIDMNVGVGISEDSQQSVDGDAVIADTNGESAELPETLPVIGSTSPHTNTSEESTKADVSNNEITDSDTKDKTINDIIDDFCNESTEIMTTKERRVSVTSDTDDKDLPVVHESQLEDKEMDVEDSEMDVEKGMDLEAKKIVPENSKESKEKESEAKEQDMEVEERELETGEKNVDGKELEEKEMRTGEEREMRTAEEREMGLAEEREMETAEERETGIAEEREMETVEEREMETVEERELETVEHDADDREVEETDMETAEEREMETVEQDANDKEVDAVDVEKDLGRKEDLESKKVDMESKVMFLEDKEKKLEDKDINIQDRVEDLVSKEESLEDKGEKIRDKPEDWADEEEDSEDLDNNLKEILEDKEQPDDKDLEDKAEQLIDSKENWEKQIESTVTEDNTDTHSCHEEPEEKSSNELENAEDSEASTDKSEIIDTEYEGQEANKPSEKSVKEQNTLKCAKESVEKKKSTNISSHLQEAEVLSTEEEEIFEGSNAKPVEKVTRVKLQRRNITTDISANTSTAIVNNAKSHTMPKGGQENTNDPYIDFDEESIENISKTIKSFSSENIAFKKHEKRTGSNQKTDSTQSKRVIMVKTASNVERVKRKLEEILENSKGEEDAAIAELQRMKKEKTDILNAITTEMEKLKSMLVKEKQG